MEESRFLTFMGNRVHYVIAQPEVPQRSSVLLLSSPLIGAFNWRKLLPELTQMGCLVVMIDLPGFGLSDCRSDVPQDHDLRASLMWGILDYIDSAMQRPMSTWHLVGHGSACLTILRMAAQHPDSVKSNVMLSPLLKMDLPRRSRASLAGRYRDTVEDEDHFRKFIEHYAAYRLDDYVLERMRRPFLRKGAREVFMSMLSHIESGSAQALRFVPIMSIWGMRDPLLDTKAIEAIHERMPESENHILKSAGHFPMETHSRALRDYLRGWIRYTDTENR